MSGLPVAEVVDGGALVQVLWVSAVAGVGLSLLFSLAVACAARAGQTRRGGAPVVAAGWTALSVACGALCTVAVVLGVIVMLSK